MNTKVENNQGIGGGQTEIKTQDTEENSHSN